MSLYLLDTDTVSLLFRTAGGEETLWKRFHATPADQRAISIITIEEMMRGALAVIRSAEARSSQTHGYERLAKLVPFLATFRIAPFDYASEALYSAMPATVRRVGSGDCKIAATALHYGLIVVTRNGKHFEQIPGLLWEDWTI